MILKRKKKKESYRKLKFKKGTEMILKFNRNALKCEWEFYAFIL